MLAKGASSSGAAAAVLPAAARAPVRCCCALKNRAASEKSSSATGGITGLVIGAAGGVNAGAADVAAALRACGSYPPVPYKGLRGVFAFCDGAASGAIRVIAGWPGERESVVEEDREDGRADSVWRGPLRSPCWCWRCRSRRKRACGEKSPSLSSPESATESFSQCSVTKDLLAPKALAVRLWTPVKTSPKAADEADWTA